MSDSLKAQTARAFADMDELQARGLVCWCLVLKRGGTLSMVQYPAARKAGGLVTWCHEGGDRWHRVAEVVTEC